MIKQGKHKRNVERDIEPAIPKGIMGLKCIEKKRWEGSNEEKKEGLYRGSRKKYKQIILKASEKVVIKLFHKLS